MLTKSQFGFEIKSNKVKKLDIKIFPWNSFTGVEAEGGVCETEFNFVCSAATVNQFVRLQMCAIPHKLVMICGVW